MNDGYLTNAEREALAVAVTDHNAARAVVVEDELRWVCGCGQPLNPSDPNAAFGDLTSHQAQVVVDVTESILADRKAERDAVRAWVPKDGDTRCQRCGHAYSPWWAPNDVWNEVVGTPDNPRGEGVYLCASCFLVYVARPPRPAAARAALARLFDQAFRTAGNQEGRERATDDMQTVRDALRRLRSVPVTAPEPTSGVGLTSVVLDALHAAYYEPGSISMMRLAERVAAAVRAVTPAPSGVDLTDAERAHEVAGPIEGSGDGRVICTNCEADDLGCTACGAHGTLVSGPAGT